MLHVHADSTLFAAHALTPKRPAVHVLKGPMIRWALDLRRGMETKQLHLQHTQAAIISLHAALVFR